jgi:hypothetical protein
VEQHERVPLDAEGVGGGGEILSSIRRGCTGFSQDLGEMRAASAKERAHRRLFAAASASRDDDFM